MKRALVAILALMLGCAAQAQTSGFPSRPRFQTVTTTAGFPGVLVSSGSPSLELNETDGGVDGHFWFMLANAGGFSLNVVNDSGSTFRGFLGATRTAGAVTSETFGNPTDNPTYSFLGTGAISGVGSGLTTLNASNLSSGTVADGRLSGTYSGALTLSNVTSLTATAATVGGSAVCRADGTNCPATAVATRCTTACSVAGIALGQTFYSNPTATATRTSTVTDTADADLQFTNVPVGNYAIQYSLLTQGSIGGSRISTSLTGGSGTFDLMGVQNCGAVGITAVAFGSFQGDATCATSTSTYVSGSGILRVTGSASTVAISWSQNVSNGTPTTRTTDSYLYLTRIK